MKGVRNMRKKNQWKVLAAAAAVSLRVIAGAGMASGEVIVEDDFGIVDELPPEENWEIPVQEQVQEEVNQEMQEEGFYDDQVQEDFPVVIDVEDVPEDTGDNISAQDVFLAGDEAAQEAAQAAAEAEFLIDGSLVLSYSDPYRMQDWLDKLTFMDSPTGSDGELMVAGVIEEEMAALGYSVSEQSFHEGFLNENMVDVPGMNIIAERGADADIRTDGILLVCAHYDSKTSPKADDPFANDKSGAAVLLETAWIVSDIYTEMDICFLFLSGEEDGGYGAVNFLDSLEEDLRSRIRAVICVDTVGLADTSVPYLLGVEYPEGNEPARILRAAGLDQVSMIRQEGRKLYISQKTAPSVLPVAQQTSEDNVPDLVAGSLHKGETPASWSVAPSYEGMGTRFADGGLSVVTLFQDVEGLYQIGDQGEVTLKEKPAAAEDSEEEAEEEETEETEAVDEEETENSEAADKKQASPFSPHALSQVADVVAETVGLYMQQG